MDDLPPEPPRQKNQHLPCPPEHIICPAIKVYYSMGHSDKGIAELCRKHYDVTKYGLSNTTVKRLRNKWNLPKARKQAHNLESIHGPLVEIKKTYPNCGAIKLGQVLRLSYGIFASHKLIAQWLSEYEPEVVAKRRRHKFKRHRFWMAGLNDFWTFDQHDKWGGRYGLYLHIGLEPTAGEIKWLRIWWNNSNPRLVASYYFAAVREAGAIPLVTQSDAGTENFGIANAHTSIHHRLDPTLRDTLQHRWMGKLMNIKPEVAWSNLNRDWKPGFEAILEQGTFKGWYNPLNTLESLVFRYLAIPWLQAELDSWRNQFNMTPRRHQKNKTLLQSIPFVIAQHPEKYNVHDFKISVPGNVIDDAEAEWAPSDHPVFELVPPVFQERIDSYLEQLGNPVVSAETFWVVYLSMLERFLAPDDHPNVDPTIQQVLTRYSFQDTHLRNEPMSIIPGLRELRHGDRLVGNNPIQSQPPTGLHALQNDDGDVVGYAEFTDEEEELEEDDPGML